VFWKQRLIPKSLSRPPDHRRHLKRSIQDAYPAIVAFLHDVQGGCKVYAGSTYLSCALYTIRKL